MTYFMAVTDDRYEFPVIIAGTQAELARGLGITDSAICSTLKRAKNGVVRCYKRNRGIKYFRMDSRTGKIIRGETPPTGFALLRAELKARREA